MAPPSASTAGRTNSSNNAIIASSYSEGLNLERSTADGDDPPTFASSIMLALLLISSAGTVETAISLSMSHSRMYSRSCITIMSQSMVPSFVTVTKLCAINTLVTNGKLKSSSARGEEPDASAFDLYST